MDAFFSASLARGSRESGPRWEERRAPGQMQPSQASRAHTPLPAHCPPESQGSLVPSNSPSAQNALCPPATSPSLFLQLQRTTLQKSSPGGGGRPQLPAPLTLGLSTATPDYMSCNGRPEFSWVTTQPTLVQDGAGA